MLQDRFSNMFQTGTLEYRFNMLLANLTKRLFKIFGPIDPLVQKLMSMNADNWALDQFTDKSRITSYRLANIDYLEKLNNQVNLLYTESK